MENSKTTSVVKLNNIEVLILQKAEQPVPIKPICDIFGIASNKQIEKIKDDEILSSVSTLEVSTGADGKEYEMVCLPLQYIFGWLFTINPKNVAPEAKENVLQFKRKCYDALYEHFVGARKFLELKEQATEKLVMQQKLDRKNFYDAKTTLKSTTEQLEEVACMTYQEFIENNRQLKIDFGV